MSAIKSQFVYYVNKTLFKKNDVCVEDFSLKFSDELSRDIFFHAKIGNREIQSYMSDWSTDFNLIRHQIERLVLCLKGNVEIRFDDEPTIIQFYRQSVILNTEKTDSDIRFRRKHLFFIKIRPNDFDNSPIVLGYCEEYDSIRTLYEAFLLLGYKFASSNNSYSQEWNFSYGINIYNTLKSGIVEKFLNPSTCCSEVVCRQIVVQHIFTLCPHGSECGFLEDRSKCYIAGNLKDIIFILGLGDIKLNGFSDWAKQKNHASKSFDWGRWNEQGLDYARQIRAIAPKEYDIWYRYSTGKSTLIIRKLKIFTRSPTI